MIQPIEPTYGAFLRLVVADDEATTETHMLPVISYAASGRELTPHFLFPGHVQTYDVFGLMSMAGPYFFFLGLLIPGAAVPEAYEEQWKTIINNARTQVTAGQREFESFVVDDTLRAWLGEPDGTEKDS